MEIVLLQLNIPKILWYVYLGLGRDETDSRTMLNSTVWLAHIFVQFYIGRLLKECRVQYNEHKSNESTNRLLNNLQKLAMVIIFLR